MIRRPQFKRPQIVNKVIASDMFDNITTTMGVMIIIGVYVIFDIIILLYNLTARSGCGGCNDKNQSGGWVTYPGPLNLFLSIDNDCDNPISTTTGKCSKSLGRWKSYAGTTEGTSSHSTDFPAILFFWTVNFNIPV